MLQQQQAASAQSAARLNESKLNSSTARGSPWQTVSAQKVPSLKDVIDTQSSAPPPPTHRASTPHLTMRQTVANPKTAPPPPQAQPKPIIASPSARHSLPENRPIAQSNSNSKPIPQSIRHSPAPAEPTLQLSIDDIVAQERRQKELLQEAVAKRDLGEIQAEQEFQEWWERESRRVQEEEMGGGIGRRDGAKGGAGRKGQGRKRGGGGGGGGRGRGRGGQQAGGRGQSQGRGQAQTQAQKS